MSKLTVAVDLAKDVFALAIAERSGKILERKRLTRSQFERFWQNREPCRVVMEACSGAHHWARMLLARGFEVRLLPAQYVRPFRRRNKTDPLDCEAILEADRSPFIKAVAVKSVEQQALLSLHRAREQWKQTRTMRINGMRGLLREFGIVAPRGADRFLARLPQLLEHGGEALPSQVRRLILAFWEEAQALAEQMNAIEKELERIARSHPVIRTLLEIPGVGPLTATALFASVGNVHTFPSGRHLASWLGLTPREHSSGSKRSMGRISKQGDPYLRTLLIHGARSALNAAQGRARRRQPLSALQTWVLRKEGELRHPNQASVALANKIARIAWTLWKYERHFDGNHAQHASRAAA